MTDTVDERVQSPGNLGKNFLKKDSSFKKIQMINVSWCIDEDMFISICSKNEVYFEVGIYK